MEDDFALVLAEANVPQEIRDAVMALESSPGAKSPILRHPAAQEIATILAMRRLEARTSNAKLAWSEMAIGLNHDFPGLDATASQLQSFCSTHLDHLIVLPAGYARRALLDASGELNTAKALLGLREQALAAIAKLEKTVGDIVTYTSDTGVKGVVKTGPSLSEYTKALKDAGELTQAFAKEAARFGLMPEVKQDRGIEVNVNLNMAGGGRMGKAMGAHPIDATFKAEPVGSSSA